MISFVQFDLNWIKKKKEKEKLAKQKYRMFKKTYYGVISSSFCGAGSVGAGNPTGVAISFSKNVKKKIL